MNDEYASLPKIIKVIDDFDIVINRGSESGVVLGSKFLIFGTGERLIDPDTGEDLGTLELVRGKARVVHVQSKMATLSSDEYEPLQTNKRVIKRTSALWAISNHGAVEEITEAQPREKLTIEVLIGDFARPI